MWYRANNFAGPPPCADTQLKVFYMQVVKMRKTTNARTHPFGKLGTLSTSSGMSAIGNQG
jgi:hypothetical protein